MSRDLGAQGIGLPLSIYCSENFFSILNSSVVVPHLRFTVERRLSERLLSGAFFVNLEGEKDFSDDHREEITEFVQSIPGFQECDEDAEDCGFQMLNHDEIATSVQEISHLVDDETHEAEDNNDNKSNKGPSNAESNNQSAVLVNYCCSWKIRAHAAQKLRYTTVQRKNESLQWYSEK
ncbi:uncharacterized protein TNCV_738051 [Trichonephila clavipes]|nr:uncharacterized protein TNCV_738051 [Trichonephila clavipes]